MKTLNFIGTGIYAQKPILVDFEKHTVDSLDACRMAVNDIYIAPEDVEIRYKKDGRDVVIKAEKGDIIVTFYREEWIVYPVAVIKNKDWKANVLGWIKKNEAKKSNDFVDAKYDACDSCETCSICKCKD